MSDLISRQAAIEALQKEIDKGIPPFDDVMGSIRCGVRLARNIIEDLPSAQLGDKEPVSLESIVHSQILDDAEKRYLKGVIRPFRDRVKYIKKICVDHLYDEPDYQICIIFNDGNDAMNFPSFDASHMYKCMEEDRAYTLDELGL